MSEGGFGEAYQFIAVNARFFFKALVRANRHLRAQAVALRIDWSANQ
jgi:hypothetical protein